MAGDMNATSIQVHASINGGPPLPGWLHIETEMVDITTWGPRPDPDWSYVDPHGHFHAYNQTDGRRHPYPTLVSKSEFHPYDTEDDSQGDESCAEEDDDLDRDDDRCDADDEPGWTETWYECAICGERVEPGRKVDGPWQEWKPGLTQWRVEIQAAVLPAIHGDKVTVRISAPPPLAQEGFGVAMVVSISHDSRTGCSIELLGVGPLGHVLR